MAVQHSLRGVHCSSLSSWPSALHVTTLFPRQLLAPGEQRLQRPARASHMSRPQVSPEPMNAEPSSLHVFSVPSDVQLFAFGLHTMSVHMPADSLQSAAEGQASALSYCPSSVHRSSWTSVQRKVPGLQTPHTPVVRPTLQSMALVHVSCEDDAPDESQ